MSGNYYRNYQFDAGRIVDRYFPFPVNRYFNPFAKLSYVIRSVLNFLFLNTFVSDIVVIPVSGC